MKNRKLFSLLLTLVLIFTPLAVISSSTQVVYAAIPCDCGGRLLTKVVYTGNWTYDSSKTCSHGKGGVDYIYKRSIITNYHCTKCTLSFEVTDYEYKTECKGV